MALRAWNEIARLGLRQEEICSVELAIASAPRPYAKIHVTREAWKRVGLVPDPDRTGITPPPGVVPRFRHEYCSTAEAVTFAACFRAEESVA